MRCPYCNQEMIDGNLNCDARSSLIFSPGDKPLKFFDRMGGTGRLTAIKNNFWTGLIVKANFCKACKKIIIDTDVVK